MKSLMRSGMEALRPIPVSARNIATWMMEKAAEAQAAQAQALLKEQENAAAAEKDKANAVRRNAFANKSQTNYSTALGEYSSDVSANVRKKTLLGG